MIHTLYNTSLTTRLRSGFSTLVNTKSSLPLFLSILLHHPHVPVLLFFTGQYCFLHSVKTKYSLPLFYPFFRNVSYSCLRDPPVLLFFSIAFSIRSLSITPLKHGTAKLPKQYKLSRLQLRLLAPPVPLFFSIVSSFSTSQITCSSLIAPTLFQYCFLNS